MPWERQLDHKKVDSTASTRVSAVEHGWISEGSYIQLPKKTPFCSLISNWYCPCRTFHPVPNIHKTYGSWNLIFTEMYIETYGLLQNVSETWSCQKHPHLALAGVAQWIEHRPVDWKVAGLVPCQGTCLGCRPNLWLGAYERQPIDVSLSQWYFSPSLTPSFPLSLKINKILTKKSTLRKCPLYAFVILGYRINT